MARLDFRHALAAELLADHAAVDADRGREQREAEASQDARRLDVHVVQVDPVGREPCGEREKSAERGEVQEHEPPGALLFGRVPQSLPHRPLREQFLAAITRDLFRFFDRYALLAQLEEVGVGRQPGVDQRACEQEDEPRQVGAGKAPGTDREWQDEGEQPGREVAHAAVGSEHGSLPALRVPVRDLRDPDRERGHSATAHETEQQDHGIHRHRQVVHRVQDVDQAPHADQGDGEQRQHRQAPAPLVHPGAERDA